MTRSLLLALVVVAGCKPKADHSAVCRKTTDLMTRCWNSPKERDEWMDRCTEAFKPDFGAKNADDYAIVAPLGREMRSVALCAADAKDCDGLQRCFDKSDREREQRARDLDH